MNARLRPICSFFAGLGALALSVVTTLTWFGPHGWLVSLFQHFPLYTGVAWLSVAVLAMLARWPGWRTGICLALSASMLGWWASPWLPQKQPILQGESHEITVVWANLWHNHQAVEQFVEWLDQLPELPDVVAVGEVFEERSVDLLKQRFPRAVHDLREGIGLFGSEDLQDLGSVLMAEARPILRGTWRRGGLETEVIACHALLPFGGGQQQTFAQLARMSHDVAQAVILGDLNTTPWSRDFQSLLEEGGLRDGRAGFGPWPTWASKRLPILRLPIDHILVRGPMAVLRFTRGPETRSDHRTLFARIRIGAAATTSS